MQAELQQIYTGHADALYALEKGMTDQYFFSGSADGFVGSWNILTGTFEKPLLKTSAPIYSLLPSHEDQCIYVGCRGGILYQVDISRRKSPRAIEAHAGDIFSLAIDRLNHRLLSAGGDGQLKVWQLPDLLLLTSLPLSNRNLRSISISPDGALLAIGSSDAHIRIMDLNKWKIIDSWEAHHPSVFSVIWTNHYDLLSGGRDAMLKKWTLQAEGNWAKQTEIKAHLYTINHLQLSPNGALLASAGRDKTVKIWNTQNLQLLKVIDRAKFDAAHTHSVNRILWLDNQMLLSTGDDKRILSWSIEKT
jgi:WD40 repeat protein